MKEIKHITDKKWKEWIEGATLLFNKDEHYVYLNGDNIIWKNNMVAEIYSYGEPPSDNIPVWLLFKISEYFKRD